MPWTILNIDDNEAGRYSVNRLLMREGYDILEAATGGEGIEIARTRPVDLIVLDVNLPDINGIDACHVLKNDERTKNIPVLLMSASFLNAHDRVRGLELGADGYLTEPLEPEVLLAHVKALLRMRQAERALDAARRDAETASRAKDHFLAVLSHELRTPLNPIIGAVELLANMGLDPEVDSILQIIQRNALLEARLIDDLLDITRIERGKMQMHVEVIDLHRLIVDVVNIFRAEVMQKQLTLAVALDARDHVVRADAARIQQVIWNLVSNAIKFTHSGKSITISTVNIEPGTICLNVSDSGIGIEEHQLARIFNAFDQGSEGMHKTFGGLGLGLSISKGIVDAHGGELTVASDGPNTGATFTLTLDTVAELPAGSDADDGDAAGEPGRTVRILFVDDHADTGATIKLLLERRGYAVVTAVDIEGAMSEAASGPFDLLITDIGLPDGSGLELAERLAVPGGMKAIAVSGYGMESDVDASRRAGFVAHMTKPVNIEDLVTVIESATAERSDA
jgi:signal transduction histidine kinase